MTSTRACLLALCLAAFGVGLGCEAPPEAPDVGAAAVDEGPPEKDEGAEPPDAGRADAAPDAEPDARPLDAAPSDARPVDVGPADARPADARPPDAEPPDAEPPDAEPPDAAPPDAEPPDAEPPDAEPPDAEPPDGAPPCIPQAERCNGIDDDCNGIVDDAPGVGEGCAIGVGACRSDGTVVCTPDGPACDARPGVAALERCDGIDNDCDGIVDEVPEAGAPCSVGLGPCRREGVIACSADGPACDVEPGPPGDEICDDIDNDCNGIVDDVPTVGEPCSAGLGECRAEGAFVCTADGVRCDAVPRAPGFELCDDIDNDCNGIVDDAPGNGVPCSAGIGACRADGVVACVFGSPACAASPLPPGEEICDGIDNDCDGAVDDVDGLGAPCTVGVGACRATGVQVCDAGGLTCDIEPGPPGVELCDGRDGDCNGVVDDAFGCVPPVFPFAGPRTDVTGTHAAEAGFVECYRDTYDTDLDEAAMRAGCTGEQLLVTCRPVGEAAFTLAAMGQRDQVFLEVEAGGDTAHEHNGSQWYYRDGHAFGFAPLGAPLNRNACDTLDDGFAEQRLCWHTLDEVGGYRCGAARGLNDDGQWERIVYMRTPYPFGGPRTDMTAVGAAEAGFAECYRDTYDADLDEAGMLAACGGDEVLVACGPVGEGTFTVAAMGERDAVFMPVAAGVDVAHDHNGSRWYYTDDFSFGFAPEGARLTRNQCDTLDDALTAQRLCWHTGESAGYRCGARRGLGASAAWQRVVYARTRFPFAGPRTDLAVAEIERAGFARCHGDLYGADLDEAAMLDGCRGSEVLVGCRPVGDDRLTLAAMGERDAVFLPVAAEPDAAHDHNGSRWYFTEDFSFGFAPLGARLARNACDALDDELADRRMCWHTVEGVGGHRCGSRRGLDRSAEWERLVYTRTPMPFEGPRAGVTEADVLGAGFVQCHGDRYDADLDEAAMRANCRGDEVLVACRPVGDDAFTVAAMGDREQVFLPVEGGGDNAHDHNGSRWYYTEDASFGFAPLGARVARVPCDSLVDESPGQRLCWHTSDGVGGYRCGVDRGLDAAGWERLVYTRDR